MASSTSITSAAERVRSFTGAFINFYSRRKREKGNKQSSYKKRANNIKQFSRLVGCEIVKVSGAERGAEKNNATLFEIHGGERRRLSVYIRI